MRRNWWYVTRRSLTTNAPSYHRVLLAGPFRTEMAAAPYCAGLRKAAEAGHPVGGYDGHESIGTEKLSETRMGVCNLALRLPVKSPEDAEPDTTETAEARLVRVGIGVPEWELWDGTEADCLALARSRGLQSTGPGRSAIVPGSLPDRYGGTPPFHYHSLVNHFWIDAGWLRQWQDHWRLALLPPRLCVPAFRGPGDSE